MPASTMNSETNGERPGSDSEDSPATRKSPASTGATFCTPPKSVISVEPRRLIRKPVDQEQRGRGEPVVEHVERRAGLAVAGQREDAQHDEAEVRDRGVGDQPRDVVLADRERARRTGR